MNNSDLFVMQVEIFRFIVGMLLLGIEFRTFKGNLRDKRSILLLSTVVFLNLIFFLRALGIYTGNLFIRQYMTAVAGLISAILLIIWTSMMLEISRNTFWADISGLLVGIIFYVIGRGTTRNSIEYVGLLFSVVSTAGIIIIMFLFVFRSSPYVIARQRVFLMAFGWMFLIIFEGLGVVYLGRAVYNVAGIMFLIGLFARLFMNFGIVLPRRVTGMLQVIIS